MYKIDQFSIHLHSPAAAKQCKTSDTHTLRKESIRAQLPGNIDEGVALTVVGVLGAVSAVVTPSGYGFTAIADCAALTAVYPTTALAEQSLMTLLHDTPVGQHPLGQHIHRGVRHCFDLLVSLSAHAGTYMEHNRPSAQLGCPGGRATNFDWDCNVMALSIHLTDSEGVCQVAGGHL